MNDIARSMRRRIALPPASTAPQHVFLPTGSTLLNLALSDRWDGGTVAGKMVNWIGDSSSGKTLLVLGQLAELAQRPAFDEYDFRFDDVEAANEFDLARLFGTKMANRVQPPAGTRADPVYSDTIQDFRKHTIAAIKRGVPFIYNLDSFDALTSDEEVGKVNKLIEKNGDGPGSYGMEKAKMGGQILRMIVRDLDKTGSALNIISQTRDNIDPMSFQKKTRSGGKALKFYATHELWTAVGKKIVRKEQVIGFECIVKVTKNKITGKVREVTFPIYYSYGIDDIGSCIDYLLKEGTWGGGEKGSAIETEQFGKLSREKLIRVIEQENREDEVRKLTEVTWLKVEKELLLERKPRYA